MKTLIYIEKEKFLCEMLSVALNSNDLECYTLNSSKPDDVIDNLYLIKELAPELLIIDLVTIGPFFSEVLKARDDFDTQIPVVGVGSNEDFLKLSDSQQNLLIKFIPKPLSLTTMKILEEYLKK